MKKRKKNIVYSTNPNYQYEYEDDFEKTIAKNKQNLKIHLNRHKADKFSVVIKNFIGIIGFICTIIKFLFLKYSYYIIYK